MLVLCVQDSFERLKRAKDDQTASWLEIIDEGCNEDVILAIVGNKVDMESNEMVHTVHAFSMRWCMHSAWDGACIQHEMVHTFSYYFSFLCNSCTTLCVAAVQLIQLALWHKRIVYYCTQSRMLAPPLWESGSGSLSLVQQLTFGLTIQTADCMYLNSVTCRWMLCCVTGSVPAPNDNACKLTQRHCSG